MGTRDKGSTCTVQGQRELGKLTRARSQESTCARRGAHSLSSNSLKVSGRVQTKNDHSPVEVPLAGADRASGTDCSDVPLPECMKGPAGTSASSERCQHSYASDWAMSGPETPGEGCELASELTECGRSDDAAVGASAGDDVTAASGPSLTSDWRWALRCANSETLALRRSFSFLNRSFSISNACINP